MYENKKTTYEIDALIDPEHASTRPILTTNKIISNFLYDVNLFIFRPPKGVQNIGRKGEER